MNKLYRSLCGERGIAMILTLLVMMLISALLVGFTAVVMSDLRFRQIDRSRAEAFYAAQAGLETLTTSLGDLFSTDYSPSGSQISALTTSPPSLPGISFTAADGSSGYQVTFDDDGSGNPAAANHNISSGPYEGLIGLLTPYTIDVTAQTVNGGEVRLQRTLQTVAIPVFQFGMFSDVDLSFFAGPNFNFGGRVHTNGNLFLAEGGGATLTISDRTTAVGEVVRQRMSNNVAITVAATHDGTVNVMTAPGATRSLAATEGSVTDGLGSSANPNWTTISLSTYNGNLRNGMTGAKRLDLPLITAGGSNPDLVRRPAVGEDTANAILYGQRYFTQASVRILLSDTAADITGLPGVTGDAPILLDGDWATTPPTGYTLNAAAGRPAIARTGAGYLSPSGTGLVGGYIKIERQDPSGTWHDVTSEILALGIASRDLSNAACAHPSANAVIRLQRVKDGVSSCGTTTTTSTNFWPQALFDPREALFRDTAPAGPLLGGVMHYVMLDANNLRRWLEGAIGTTGTDTISNNGFTVYFSDRRNNRNLSNAETGEYGYEDFVNPSGTATGNGTLDAGEDVNENGTLETYGQYPQNVPVGATSPLTSSARPWTQLTAAQAKMNRAILFRRALKLVNGAPGNIVSPGLTVASENPVYVEGNWNASNSAFTGTHVATAVLADAVTLLSNNWNDSNSFANPYSPGSRTRTDTYYRLAIIGGKGPSFPWFSGQPTDFGTDGGTHNFLRMLESGATVYYRGAIATFYYNRQAVGTYKCCTTVYGAPTRAFAFDTDFLDPTKLPPLTPVFRDLNTLTFSQELRPGF
jgi:hypothetical protein